MANFHDAWVITQEERAKHDNQFYMMNPVAGFLSGEQVKMFFLQSGLPQNVLGKIWQLSDINADGKMDKQEFSIAMYLIKKALQGFDIPPILPPTLLSNVPLANSFNPPMNSGMIGASFGMPQNPSLLYSSSTLPYPGNSIPMMSADPRNFSTIAKPPTLAVAGGEWSITPAQRLKYKHLFNNHDASHKGYLTGLEAKGVLSQSGLTHPVLAQIWSLADIDTDGNLSPDEFCVAMFLIDQAKSGFVVPPMLPPDLVPPSYRKGRRPSEPVGVNLPITQASLNAIVPNKPGLLNELGSNIVAANLNMSGSETCSIAYTEPESTKIITFEDKRKENFDKGQAELERRRAMLRDQQLQESEERIAAERAEQEKRDKLRQEQEMKRQIEQEKQLERQRQMEMEKEEQRRKLLEQKEAARKELERQRQLEWEKQRRDQLMADKSREQNLVDDLKHETGQHKLKFESLRNKKMGKYGKKPQVVEEVDEDVSKDDDEPADLEKDVDSIVEEVKQGKKKYVTLKWTPKNTLVVDKTGPAGAKFDDIVKELLDVEKAGQARYVFTSDGGKLYLIVWVSSKVPDNEKVLYKKKLVKVKKLLKKNFFYKIVKNAPELDLSMILKSSKEFDFKTWFFKYGKKFKGEDDSGSSDDEQADLDKDVDSIVEEVKNGARKFVTLKWNPKNTLVVDKSGAAGAKFDDLVTLLLDAEKTGEGRYAFFNQNGKLFLIVWAPSKIRDAQKVLYKKFFRKLKRLLKKSFLYVIPSSSSELNLDFILKSAQSFDFTTFFSKYTWKHHVTIHEGSGGESSDDNDKDDNDGRVTLDSKVESAIDEVSKGKRRYVTLKWTSKAFVIDKSGGPGAKFEDLVKDLTAAKSSGEGRLAIYFDDKRNKLLFIVWIPSDISKDQQKLYKKKARKLKKLLKKSFSYVTIRSSGELDPNWILKSIKPFDFDSFLPKEWQKFGDFGGKGSWQKTEWSSYSENEIPGGNNKAWKTFGI